jgi:hypothetical protein
MSPTTSTHSLPITSLPPLEKHSEEAAKLIDFFCENNDVYLKSEFDFDADQIIFSEKNDSKFRTGFMTLPPCERVLVMERCISHYRTLTNAVENRWALTKWEGVGYYFYSMKDKYENGENKKYFIKIRERLAELDGRLFDQNFESVRFTGRSSLVSTDRKEKFYFQYLKEGKLVACEKYKSKKKEVGFENRNFWQKANGIFNTGEEIERAVMFSEGIKIATMNKDDIFISADDGKTPLNGRYPRQDGQPTTYKGGKPVQAEGDTPRENVPSTIEFVINSNLENPLGNCMVPGNSSGPSEVLPNQSENAKISSISTTSQSIENTARASTRIPGQPRAPQETTVCNGPDNNRAPNPVGAFIEGAWDFARQAVRTVVDMVRGIVRGIASWFS